MKKITFVLSGLCLILGAKAQTFSDGFEADTVGKLGPQSPYWTTWSKDDGGEEDVDVIDSVNHTPGGTKSIYFFSENANGGPSDVILPFNSVPLTSGKFSFTSWFKIPTGKTAYFNFQGDTINGDIFTFECKMDNAGNISIESDRVEVLATTHPVDTWFKLTIDVNLNINSWSLSIDDVLRGKWKNTVTQIVAVDFYPADDIAQFWVDDVSFTVTPYVLPVINGAANAATVPVGLVGQTRKLSFTARNLGQTEITSFDVNISHNGASPVKETVTGVKIPSYATQTVALNSPFVLTADENTYTAIISNVNGAGVDGDAIDDTISTVTTGVTPAAGKMVFAEEVTGTWCTFCPRGAVFNGIMSNTYKGYYAGVAVHSNNTLGTDPMTLNGYGDSLAITNYPGILTDRYYLVDPTIVEAAFMERITINPEGLLKNGATYDPATRELKVSITTTLQQDISGDFRVGCVITEDSVSGVTSDYDQANAYAGGARGPMGGFELLPDPVPAAQMNYNYVARTFSPGPEGFENAYGASATTGQVITHNFIYTLPANWDVNQLHIIGVMIAPTLDVVNASYTTVKEAINNGFIIGTVVGVNELADAPDAIQLAPNPARDYSTISLNVKTESAVSVEIYNATGALVQSKSYGKMKGAYRLPVETQQLINGIYFIRVNVNNQPTVLKLIKE